MYIYRVLAWYITNNNYVFIYIYITNLTNVENRAIDSIPLSIFKIGIHIICTISIEIRSRYAIERREII